MTRGLGDTATGRINLPVAPSPRRFLPQSPCQRFWVLYFFLFTLSFLLASSGCASLGRGSGTARELRIQEYEKAFPYTSPGRLELMKEGRIFRGMTKAQFQAVVGWNPEEEVTLEARPRHMTSLRYRTDGDKWGAVIDVFVFLNAELYKWELRSFEPTNPEAPKISHEYSGQK